MSSYAVRRCWEHCPSVTQLEHAATRCWGDHAAPTSVLDSWNRKLPFFEAGGDGEAGGVAWRCV